MAESKKEIELCKYVCPPGVIAIVLLALGIWLLFVNLIIAIILFCLIPVEILFFIWMYRRSTRATP